jgi:O-succinylbenzoate synthase
MLTKYQSYSDKDLVHLLTKHRGYSEVIDELCDRVEKKANMNTCPICEGDIEEFLGDNDGK